VKLFNQLQRKHDKVSQKEVADYLFEALYASNSQEMKSAYKKLVVKIHPDKTTDFKELIKNSNAAICFDSILQRLFFIRQLGWKALFAKFPRVVRS
jgi:hypothetical protein